MTATIDIANYRPTGDLLKDRIIAVTGAGSGIGMTAAKTFARYGATVVLMGRTIAKLETVYDDIEKQGGPQPAIYPINFEGAAERDYDDMAATFQTEFGRLDGLLFNASELGQITPIANYSVATWNRIIQVNLTSQFMMCRTLIPLLAKSGSASVVFTGSSVGFKGHAFWGAYSVTKAATENLMQVLAQELFDTNGTRVNSINPGATRTNMRASAFPAENPNDLTTPEEIMPIYLYLMGQDSKDTNGQAFHAQP